MKEKILKLLDNDHALCRFTELLLQQIDNDDEPWEDKGRQILLAALSDEKADDLFLFSSLFWGQKVNCLEISK